MMLRTRHQTALLALFVMATGVISCAKGVEAPQTSPEVYILDGLLVDYGAETPCYGSDGVEEHAIRCGQWGKLLKPQHPVVQVSLEPFAIDQHEVTNRQYRHCVEMGDCEAPWYTDSFDQGIDYYYNLQDDDYPVQQVTWTMAQTYCEFRGRRLPTDAEWQRVAQGSPVNGPKRIYPAKDINLLEACQDPNANIAAEACDGRREFSRATEPGGDYVEEGYDADLQPARIYHLFSNVSEFTADFYQEDVTCRESLPPGDLEGGDYDDWDDCIPCDDCDAYTGTEAIECNQECKFCEACSGTYQDGTPYRPDGYEAGPLECHIDCWGATRESPTCVRWSDSEQPLSPSEVAGTGTEKIVRGGHVGIPNNSSDICRYRADYREKRVRPDGSADTQNFATSKGLGFRCARTLVSDERAALSSDGRIAHLVTGAEPEALSVSQPVFIAVPDAGAEPPADAGTEPPTDTQSGPGPGDCTPTCVDVDNCIDKTCDGVDDDCDGVTDEDYIPQATSCGAGACQAAGATQCVDGSEQDTCTPGQPDCTGKMCGDDGCEGTCGDCPDDQTCDAGQCSGTTAVDISGFAFVPADITIESGTTVLWTNLDSSTHSVESMADDGEIDPSGPLDSPQMSQDDTFSHTFDDVGVFEYRCGPHPTMTGSVTVE